MIIRKSSALPIVLGLITVFIIFVVLENVTILSSIGIFIFFWSLFTLVVNKKNILPIRNLILLIASLQWCVGPFLAYSGVYNHYKYFMYIPEDKYMLLASPGVLAFAIGLFITQGKNEYFIISKALSDLEITLSKDKNLPIIILMIGLLFTFLGGYLPSGLSFIGYLLSNLIYVGMILIIYSDKKYKGLLFALFFLVAFIGASASGLFHDFFLWSILLGLYFFHRYKISSIVKLVIITFSVFLFIFVQSVKHDYRELTWYGEEEASALTFLKISKDKIFSDSSDGSGALDVESAVIRINQGWIISRLMQMVPLNYPYAEGDTIIVAIKAALLPRLLFPDKPNAGGKENYEKYTGFELNRTSMGISLIGEGYINYGVTGSIVFMFVMGVFISLFIGLSMKISARYPIFIAFLPVIFFHVVKAETDLITVLNYLIKSFIFIYMFSILLEYLNKKRSFYI